jgi:hypothetical protein
MKMLLVMVLLLVPTSALSETGGSAPDARLDPYIVLLRTNLKAERAAVIVSNIHLSDAEANAFWPVYNNYQKELSTVGDEKVALIKDYAAHLNQLDDKEAAELTARALAMEEQRLQIIKKYIGEFGKVLSAKQVARFFQLEMQMQRMIDLQIGAELPLVQ